MKDTTPNNTTPIQNETSSVSPTIVAQETMVNTNSTAFDCANPNDRRYLRCINETTSSVPIFDKENKQIDSINRSEFVCYSGTKSAATGSALGQSGWAEVKTSRGFTGTILAGYLRTTNNPTCN